MNNDRTTLRKIFLFPVWVAYWAAQVTLGLLLWPAFILINPDSTSWWVRIAAATFMAIGTMITNFDESWLRHHGPDLGQRLWSNLQVGGTAAFILILWAIYSYTYKGAE